VAGNTQSWGSDSGGEGDSLICMQQVIRFCTSKDGAQIAYAIHGSGSPLVRTAHWLTHLDFDWQSPLWRHWLEGLGRDHTVIRYDDRGCGLSDRNVEDMSPGARVGDLEAVVDSAGVRRFALLGVSGGGPTAISYAVSHPDRVSHLILYGTYARGRHVRPQRSEDKEKAELLISMIKVGWGGENPAFRRVFSTLFVPDASEEQMRWFDEAQRRSTSAENAIRLRRSRDAVDVTEDARRVQTPTLVMHARDDAMVPFDEGRHLAALIPGARFVPLDGRNHILLEGEPAWTRFLAELEGFVGPGVPADKATGHRLASLSRRELHVLKLVAQGLSNQEIAEQTFLSERTVERHLSNIYAKLGLSGKAARAGAAAIFSKTGEELENPKVS
jgi:pimeloyl-ACP methyl ester carboxylesterase/DNA-binding CsgD family transcriptional regulator